MISIPGPPPGNLQDGSNMVPRWPPRGVPRWETLFFQNSRVLFHKWEPVLASEREARASLRPSECRESVFHGRRFAPLVGVVPRWSKMVPRWSPRGVPRWETLFRTVPGSARTVPGSARTVPGSLRMVPGSGPKMVQDGPRMVSKRGSKMGDLISPE